MLTKGTVIWWFYEEWVLATLSYSIFLCAHFTFLRNFLFFKPIYSSPGDVTNAMMCINVVSIPITMCTYLPQRMSWLHPRFLLSCMILDCSLFSKGQEIPMAQFWINSYSCITICIFLRVIHQRDWNIFDTFKYMDKEFCGDASTESLKKKENNASSF